MQFSTLVHGRDYFQFTWMGENIELESICSINSADQKRMDTAIIYGILLCCEQGKINKMQDS